MCYFDHIIGKITNCFAKMVNHTIECFEHFIPESHRVKLLSDLFYGIRFGSIRWNRKQLNIFWVYQDC